MKSKYKSKFEDTKQKILSFKLANIFGNKEFVKIMWKLFLPAALQSLVSIAVVYVDNLFVAQFVGTAGKTALGLCSPFLMLTQTITCGAIIGIGIMTAQYYGSNNLNKTRQTIYIKIWLALFFGVIFTVLMLFIPGQIISITSGMSANGDQTQIFEFAKQYMFWSALSIIPAMLNFALSFSFRETRQPKFPLYAALVAMVVNIILDPLLIISSSSNMEAIRNVALATMVSRALQALVQIAVIVLRRDNVMFFFKSYKIDWKVIKAVFKNGWQIFFNEILYGLSGTFLIICLLHYGDDYSAASADNINVPDASTTVSLIIQYTTIIWPALASGSAVLVGGRLGANAVDEAYRNSKWLMAWGAVMATFMGLTILAVSFFINPILSPEADSTTLLLTQHMEWVMIPIIMSQGVFSMVYYSLQAGGSKWIFFADGLISLIWTILMASLTFTSVKYQIPPTLFVAILESNQIAKMFIAIFIYKKSGWNNNLTT